MTAVDQLKAINNKFTFQKKTITNFEYVILNCYHFSGHVNFS